MTWQAFAQWEVRRRAVVGGRAFDEAGKPFTDAASLSLCRVLDETAPAVSKRKGKNAQPVSDTQARQPRRHACHMRRDGTFFFLDVPAGRYVLNRVDAAGAVDTPFVCISLPLYGPRAKMPIVSIEFEIVKRTSETDSSSGRQMVGPGLRDQPQLKGN